MRDIIHIIQAFRDATKAMEDLCTEIQMEYQKFREHSRLTLNEWHVWRNKRNNPTPGSFILVRRDNKIQYAYYIGERRILIIEGKVSGEYFQSYILSDLFADGDEWINIETLKK